MVQNLIFDPFLWKKQVLGQISGFARITSSGGRIRTKTWEHVRPNFGRWVDWWRFQPLTQLLAYTSENRDFPKITWQAQLLGWPGSVQNPKIGTRGPWRGYTGPKWSQIRNYCIKKWFEQKYFWPKSDPILGQGYEYLCTILHGCHLLFVV